MRQFETIGRLTAHMFWIALGASSVTFLYGAAVPVFRYAFGIELPSPFAH
jgi:hypothetical protein